VESHRAWTACSLLSEFCRRLWRDPMRAVCRAAWARRFSISASLLHNAARASAS